MEPAKAHWLTRPDVWENFGYRADHVPQVTELDQELLDQADKLTRQLLAPAYAALEGTEGEDFLHGLAAMRSLLPVPQFPG